MSENFSISGYKIETQNVYDTLMSKNLTASQLKTADLNDDGVISEDELQEFEAMEEEADNTNGVSNDKTVQYFKVQQQREENELAKNQKKLYRAQRTYSKYETKLQGLDDESNLKGKYQSKLSQAESEINSLNSAISKNIENMNTIHEKIMKSIKNAKKLAEAKAKTAAAEAEYNNAVAENSASEE